MLESGGCERGYGCGCGWEGADGGKWERAFGALTPPLPSLDSSGGFIIEGERVGWGRVEGSEEIDIGAFAFYENAHGGTFFNKSILHPSWLFPYIFTYTEPGIYTKSCTKNKITSLTRF